MKKTKTKISQDFGIDIKYQLKIDIEYQLKMLRELAKSIDKEILKNEGINHKRKRAIEKIRDYK